MLYLIDIQQPHITIRLLNRSHLTIDIA